MEKQSDTIQDNWRKYYLLEEACSKWTEIEFCEQEIDDACNLKQNLMQQLVDIIKKEEHQQASTSGHKQFTL
ncbi:hypothetical protein [Spiroplasma ixodetis]|uniref:hypothetical protein n=1 Tax=Spiroplasma ixodetis TaxID=2141 RepID=UPI002576ABC0|nr:hypothetical protein [Spiroplasma ixodetis]WJG70783.1 hypothetical protein SIXOD_v1c20190 [Spiroplasma ixodetis Y32]